MSDTRVPLSDRLTIEGWEDFVIVGTLAFVGIILLTMLLRGGKR